jgi:hypothetical protein
MVVDAPRAIIFFYRLCSVQGGGEAVRRIGWGEDEDEQGGGGVMLFSCVCFFWRAGARAGVPQNVGSCRQVDSRRNSIFSDASAHSSFNPSPLTHRSPRPLPTTLPCMYPSF